MAARTPSKTRKPVKKRPDPIVALVRQLGRQATETISDILDVMGLPEQVLATTVRPIVPGMRLCGPAFCVRGRAIDAVNPGRPTQYEVDRQLPPGCVVVMATGGYTGSAVIGGNVAASYGKRGAAGLVVDGLVRDPHEIRGFLPTFAAGVSPKRPANRWNVVAFGESVALPGQGGGEVVVHPGDLVLGDAGGVVVIPQAIAAQVVAAAEKLVEAEGKVLADIRRGRDREQALKAHDRFGHIRKIIPE